MNSNGTIGCTIDEGIATILVDRPEKLNSLTPEMLDQLDSVLRELEVVTDCRVLLLRGAGFKAFCSGADLPAFAQQTRESAWQRWVPHGHRVFDRLAALPIPSLAILKGNAFGGGLELALACDLRLASVVASVGLPEVGLGALPGWGGTHRLVSAVGMARARQMILTGLPVSASVACQWGLVTECADVEGLDSMVASYVDALLSRGPVALGLAKSVLRAVGDTGHNDVLEALAGALTVTTDDLAEGISAFREHRPSEFHGR